MLHEKYAEQNNVTIASNTTFDLQYERTCLRTHTAIDCSFIAGWHLLLPTGAWTKTTTTSFHTHHFVTAVREKSPKFKSFRFIMNPIPEKKKIYSLILLDLLCLFQMRRHGWSTQKSVRSHLLQSEPRPAALQLLIGSRGGATGLSCTQAGRQVSQCGAVREQTPYWCETLQYCSGCCLSWNSNANLWY